MFSPTPQELADLIAFVTTIDDSTPTIAVPVGQLAQTLIVLALLTAWTLRAAPPRGPKS